MEITMQSAPNVAGAYGEIQYERNTTELIDEIKEIDKKLVENPAQSDLWIEKGYLLRKRQLLCREAVESQSIALTYDPFNPLLYRYRGHYCCNIGRYAEAAADFELSLRLDPKNWDTWYHSGLAYYLLKDYKRARKAYEGCIALTCENDIEPLTAVTDWYYLTLRHLGEDELAQQAIARIHPDWTVKDNLPYFNRIMVYKGLRKPEEVLAEAETFDSNILFATQTYGLSYYYETLGDFQAAKKVLDRIMERYNGAWSCFAVRAAEVRLADWNDSAAAPSI